MTLFARTRSRIARTVFPDRSAASRAPDLRDGIAADRILCLAPHPDDDTLGAGGVLLRARQRGAAVHVVYLTSGAADPAGGDAQVREQEAATVNAALGATYECWRYPTRGIPCTDDVADRLHATMTRVHPQVIVLPFFGDDHPDHRQTALLFAAACRRAVPDVEVWAYQVYTTVRPTIVVDITDVMDEKCALVRRWESQSAKRDWAHYIRGMNAMQSRYLHMTDARYAEAFIVSSGAEYVAGDVSSTARGDSSV